MKILLLIQLLLISVSVTSQTLRNAYSKLNPDAQSVEIRNSKFDPTMFIVIYQTTLGWKEEFDVVQFKDSKIRWKANFDTQPSPYIMKFTSVKQIKISGIQNPVFELFGEYLNGFGEYNLYELRGHTLYLIANTFALDNNGGIDTNYKGKDCDRTFKLKVYYKDLNNDGVSDICLKDSMKLESVYDSSIRKAIPAQKVLLYNRLKGRFIEDLNYRKGFSKREQ